MNFTNFISMASAVGINIGGSLKRLKSISNRGFRSLDGRLSTVSNATPLTWQDTIAAAQEFDHIEIVFHNTDSTFSPLISACKVAVTSQLGVDAGAGTGTNNSAGAWTSVTKCGMTAFQLGVAPVSRAGVNGRPRYTTSDRIPLSSKARTDTPGALPLIVVRAFCSDSTITTLTVRGNGTDDFTNWASRADGRIWITRTQSGDKITDPTLFTTTTNVSQSLIAGVRFYYRGVCVSMAGVGDSITGGRGTWIGDDMILQAIAPLSNRSGTAIEYSNHGWSGCPGAGSVGLFNRVIDLCESRIKPQILVFPIASPNDFPSTITQALIDAEWAALSLAVAACIENGVVPILWTWLPTNTAVRAYGATDSLRIAYNARAMSGVFGDVTIVDFATPMSGVVDGTGQMQMLVGATTDGIHPNDTGNAIMAALLRPVILKIIRG